VEQSRDQVLKLGVIFRSLAGRDMTHTQLSFEFYKVAVISGKLSVIQFRNEL
jgi:hypothetical protein